MRLRIALGLFLSFTLGCYQSTIRPYRPPPPAAVATVAEEPSSPVPRLAPESSSAQKKAEPSLLRPRIAPRIKNKKYLPTHLHARDRSVMVLVPAGTYQVHAPASRNSATRLQATTLPAFYIDRTEITVAQYQAFQDEYDATGFTGEPPCPQCPAVGIDWHSAQRYCLWAGKKLPTEAEWEAAARGPTAQRLPWGNKHFAQAGNILGAEDGFDRLAPVGSFPLGASPFAALDMIGNAWEWVSPVTAVSPAKAAQPSGKIFQTVKGGSWRSPKKMAVISFRNTVESTIKNPTFGFRCAKPASLFSNERSGTKLRKGQILTLED